MVQQPPNSPDLNVLDLGLFNAIDKLQHKNPRRTVEELVYAVKHAYEHLAPTTINRAFVSLQCVMEQILLHDGDNNFALPHMGKSKLEKELGQLPFQHHLSPQARRKAHRMWIKQRRARHIEMWGSNDSDLEDCVEVVASDNAVEVVASQADTMNLEDAPPLSGQLQQPETSPDADGDVSGTADVVVVAQHFSL